MQDQVRGARPDAEALVVGDRRVDGVEAKQQVGHGGAVAQGGLERFWPQRLAAERPVDVGHAEHHELGLVYRDLLTHASTSRITAAVRDTISSSSASELTKGGASRIWSPA